MQKKKRSPKLGKPKESSFKIIKHHVKPAEIFTSCHGPDTTEEQLTEFGGPQFIKASNIFIAKLKTKYDSYSSFQVTLPCVAFADALALDNWPDGALVKRFYAPATTSAPNSNTMDKNPQENSIIMFQRYHLTIVKVFQHLCQK